MPPLSRAIDESVPPDASGAFGVEESDDDGRQFARTLGAPAEERSHEPYPEVASRPQRSSSAELGSRISQPLLPVVGDGEPFDLGLEQPSNEAARPPNFGAVCAAVNHRKMTVSEVMARYTLSAEQLGALEAAAKALPRKTALNRLSSAVKSTSGFVGEVYRGIREEVHINNAVDKISQGKLSLHEALPQFPNGYDKRELMGAAVGKARADVRSGAATAKAASGAFGSYESAEIRQELVRVEEGRAVESVFYGNATIDQALASLRSSEHPVNGDTYLNLLAASVSSGRTPIAEAREKLQRDGFPVDDRATEALSTAEADFKIYDSVRTGQSTAYQAVAKRASPASSLFKDALLSAQSNHRVVQDVYNGSISPRQGLGRLKRPDAWTQGAVREAAVGPVSNQVRNGWITLEEALEGLGHTESPRVRDSLLLAHTEFQIKEGTMTADEAVDWLRITDHETIQHLRSLE